MVVITEEEHDVPATPPRGGGREEEGAPGDSGEASGGRGGGHDDAGEGAEGAGGETGDSVVLSDEDRRAMVKEAAECKERGNDAYKRGDYEQAKTLYSECLDKSPPGDAARAVYFSNRAACNMQLNDLAACVEDCTGALEADGRYAKALLRRMAAHEGLGDAEKALADAKSVLEIEAGNAQAASAAARLEPVVKERLEAQKEEMMGKLKDLGNTLLGKVGLSLDNFKATKDPSTGNYSINFQQ